MFHYWIKKYGCKKIYIKIDYQSILILKTKINAQIEYIQSLEKSKKIKQLHDLGAKFNIKIGLLDRFKPGIQFNIQRLKENHLAFKRIQEQALNMHDRLSSVWNRQVDVSREKNLILNILRSLKENGDLLNRFNKLSSGQSKRYWTERYDFVRKLADSVKNQPGSMVDQIYVTESPQPEYLKLYNQLQHYNLVHDTNGNFIQYSWNHGMFQETIIIHDPSLIGWYEKFTDIETLAECLIQDKFETLEFFKSINIEHLEQISTFIERLMI